MSSPVAGKLHFNGGETRWMHKQDVARRVSLDKIPFFMDNGWELNRIDPLQSKRISNSEMSLRYQAKHPKRYKEIRTASYRAMMDLPDDHPRKVRYMERKKRNGITYNARIKEETLSHYGPNGQLQCSWAACDVTDVDMLTLDHIADDGWRDRLGATSQGGCSTYQILRRNGFPDGYQTLCANHQLKKDLLRRRGCRKA